MRDKRWRKAERPSGRGGGGAPCFPDLVGYTSDLVTILRGPGPGKWVGKKGTAKLNYINEP